MRTLKKSLSLVLVLAMVFSFCVVGSSAAFTDADEISAKYVEAVEVMSALGIVSGMGDDSFAPQGQFTRGQAASIIVMMLDAKDEAKTSVCTFTDVEEGDWYYHWIGYCQAKGIMKGYGDGTVGPNDALTGAQFALMVMKAAGIDTSSVNPATFELDTVSLAKKEGIASVEELVGDFTREIATAVAFRGLLYGEEEVVESIKYVVTGLTSAFVADTNSANGKAYDTYSEALIAGQKNNTYTFGTDFTINSATETETVYNYSIYEETFGGSANSGVLTLTAANEDACVANALLETPETVVIGGDTYIASAGLDLIGHNVKVYSYPTLKGDAAYAIVDKAVKVETITGVYANQTALNKALVALGFKTGTVGSATVYNDYVVGGTIPYSSTNPMSLIVISNSNTKAVNSVVVLNRDVARIDSITSKVVNGETVYTYTDDATNSFKSTEIFTEDTLAVGDVVYVATSGDFKFVEKAEAFEATYTGTTTVPTSAGTKTTYTFGDIAYTVNLGITTGANYLASATNLVVGETYSLILDDYGRIAAVIGESAAPEYAYLAAFGQKSVTDALGVTSSKLTGALYFADGTNEIVVLDTTAGALNGATYGSQAATATTVVNAGAIFSYQVNPVNGAYILTALNNNVTAAPVANGSNIVGTLSTANVYANDESVTFFVTGTYSTNPASHTLSVQILKGVSVLAGKTLEAAYADDSTGTALYVVGLESAAYIEVAPTVYFYAGEYTSVENGLTETVTYTVYANGEPVTLTYSAKLPTGVTEYTTAGMVKVNSTNTNIQAAGGNTFDGLNVLDYYNGTLTIDDSTDIVATVDMSKVYDMTYYSEFNGFVNLANTTIVVYGQYKTVPGSANVIEQLYVVAVDSNDAVIEEATYTLATGKTAVLSSGVFTLTGSPTVAELLGGIVVPDGASVYYGAAGESDLDTIAAYNPTGTDAVANTNSVYVIAEDGQTMIEYTIA